MYIAKVEELKAFIKENDFSDEERAAWASDIAAACKALEKHAMRRMIIETGERADGRAPEEIRPLYIRPGYLPRVHGSGLFQRGQTQVMSVATLGLLNEAQRLDTIDPQTTRRYMHQYNFPPYCTGEVGRMGAPKRREVGHGALAERAILPVLPNEDEYPGAGQFPQQLRRLRHVGVIKPARRLVSSWGWSRSQGLGCSPIKEAREHSFLYLRLHYIKKRKK